ncbi:hypothetical protein GGER_08130 [Serratia rubidaea]
MSEINTRHDAPLYIKVHANDNVAIVVNPQGLAKGTLFPCGLRLIEHVPQGHKTALINIAAGEAIIRYGETIGYAQRDILRGGWIDESLVTLPAAPALDSLPLANRVPPPLPPLEGYTFDGYRNADGSVGTKNLLGITTSVHCVAGVVDFVVKIIERDLLPQYPNVDGVVALNHLYGCGVAINAPAAVVPIRTIHNLALNPNFGGEVMVVGLGCEKLQPERLLQGTPDVQPISLDAGQIVRLQDEKHIGFKSMVDDILALAERHLRKLNQRRREPCPASELVVGMQCGGSDAFSGVTANPAVGFASDLLVRCGATVMFSEVTEVRDAIHLLTPRVVDQEVGRRLLEEMRWYDDYLSQGQSDRSANPSPGNKKAGWRTWWKRRWGRSPSPAPALLSKCSPRPAPEQARPDLRRHARQRLRLRHPAAGLRHHPAGVHHRARHAVRPDRRAGHQNGDPQRAGRTLARSDGYRRRQHRQGRGHHRAGGLAAV